MLESWRRRIRRVDAVVNFTIYRVGYSEFLEYVNGNSEEIQKAHIYVSDLSFRLFAVKSGDALVPWGVEVARVMNPDVVRSDAREDAIPGGLDVAQSGADGRGESAINPQTTGIKSARTWCKDCVRGVTWPYVLNRGHRQDADDVDRLRIPVKLITRSGANLISDSGQSGHRSERSDAGVGNGHLFRIPGREIRTCPLSRSIRRALSVAMPVFRAGSTSVHGPPPPR